MYHSIIFLLVLIILIMLEYKDHDCLPQKDCNCKILDPPSDMSSSEKLDFIRKEIRKNNTVVFFRQALIAGIIVSFISYYYINEKIPDLKTWLFLSIVISVIVFFSYSWLFTHYYYPNSRKIEELILKMQEK